MRVKLYKTALAAGFGLALALTFSCSSDDGGGQSSSSVVPSSSSATVSLSSSSFVQGSSSDVASSSSSVSLSSSSDGSVSSSSSVSLSSSSGGSVSSSSGVSSSSVVLRECEGIFNPANKFCYDGEVYDKCGGQTYTNPADKFCYDGTVYDKCGGKEYANPANKFCYNGTAYDKCNGQEYANPADKFCYDGTVYDKCGGKEYANPANKFCYDGEVYNKCDGMEYNPSSQICTNGVANTARCNGEGYNPLLEECIAGVVVDKSFTPGLIGECVWDKNPTITARGAVPSGVTYKDPYNICTSPTVVYKYDGGSKTWPKDGGPLTEAKTYSDVKATLNCPVYDVTPITCPPLKVNAGAEYIIECSGGYSDANCGGVTKKTVTLSLDECVEINVMGYNDPYNLPTVIMRCETQGTQQNSSVTMALNVNGKTTNTIGSYCTVPLGKIKVGDNVIWYLCVTALSGATGVKCTGPGQ